MASAIVPAGTENPMLFDLKDLENAIVQLTKTNAELTDLCRGSAVEMNGDELFDLRVVIVENEYAIDSKLQKRKEILATLNLPLHDDFEQRYRAKVTARPASELDAVLLTARAGDESSPNGISL